MLTLSLFLLNYIHLITIWLHTINAATATFCIKSYILTIQNINLIYNILLKV